MTPRDWGLAQQPLGHTKSPASTQAHRVRHSQKVGHNGWFGFQPWSSWLQLLPHGKRGGGGQETSTAGGHLFQDQRSLCWQKAQGRRDYLGLPDSLPALKQLPPRTPTFWAGKNWLGEMVAGQNKQVDDCPLPDENKGQA